VREAFEDALTVIPTGEPGTPAEGGSPPESVPKPAAQARPATTPRKADAASSLASLALGDDADTAIELSARWEPPLAGEPTPVVPILGDHEPTPNRAVSVAETAPTSVAPPSNPPRPVAAPLPAPSRPAVPPTWLSDRKTARQLPKGLKVVAALGIGLLALIVVAARCTVAQVPVAVTTTFEARDDLLVSAETLRKRKEMTPDDFRTAPAPAVMPSAARASADAFAPPTPEELADRHARRQENPEDLAAQRGRDRGRFGVRAQPRTTEPDNPRPLFRVVDVGAARRMNGVREAGGEGTGAPARRRLVAAASTITARLAAPVVVRGASANVVAEVRTDQDLPAGTRLVGRARATQDGIVQIAFRTAVLPDGTSLRIHAEAQDAEGASGLRGRVTGAPDDEPSMAGEVAENSARRALVSAVGGGLLGGAVDDALRVRDETQRVRHRGSETVALPRGLSIRIFFLEEMTE
jgi:type IV secretory pathway VirB10-like protein